MAGRFVGLEHRRFGKGQVLATGYRHREATDLAPAQQPLWPRSLRTQEPALWVSSRSAATLLSAMKGTSCAL